MPLHVDIRVNDLLINTLHIGRISGGTGSDNINTYMVVEGERPQSIEDWIDGVEYNHRYGDGAEVCVARALDALGYISNRTVTNSNVTNQLHPPKEFRDRSNGE